MYECSVHAVLIHKSTIRGFTDGQSRFFTGKIVLAGVTLTVVPTLLQLCVWENGVSSQWLQLLSLCRTKHI